MLQVKITYFDKNEKVLFSKKIKAASLEQVTESVSNPEFFMPKGTAFIIIDPTGTEEKKIQDPETVTQLPPDIIAVMNMVLKFKEDKLSVARLSEMYKLAKIVDLVVSSEENKIIIAACRRRISQMMFDELHEEAKAK